MNLKELEQIIFKPASNLMKKRGEKAFKEGLVSNVKGRKIENVHHLYGEVSNNISHKKFNTHIKVNFLNKKLDSVSCTCNDFKNISTSRDMFMCEHLTATAYKFISLLYKKSKALKNLPKEKNKKIQLDIGVRITHKLWKGVTSYEVEFRLGEEYKYLIINLKDFIYSLDNKKNIYFNNKFTYNSKEYSFSEDAIRIIDFIKEFVYENKGISPNGRNLIISPDYLRKFLECVGEDKIQFKYNGMEYKTAVFNKDLPLSFTFKEKNEKFILTTHKKLPIPLNENRDVYLFNWQLYLPSKNQTEKYRSLYGRFIKENEILYNKNIENYNKIISLLSDISNDITIAESVKNFSTDSLKMEFLIYKEKWDIYCDVKAVYYNEKINILEGSSNKQQLIRDLNKEEKILMKLEYYKFIKRKDRLMFTGGDEELFDILSKRKDGIHSLGKVMLGKGLEDIRVYNSGAIKVDFYEEKGYIKFNYNISGIEGAELSNIFESYRSNNRFYKTRNNEFIDFQDDDVREFFDLIDVLNASENIEEASVKIEKNKALYIAESLKNRNFKLGQGINLLEDIEKKLNDINSKEITLPKGIKAKLREYQIKGFRWFKNLSDLGFGGILADEMGLGKTIQTIAFIVAEEGKKSLIIAPTSLIYNWRNEIERFAPNLKVGIAHGEKAKREKIIDEIDNYDLILTTYGTLRNNIEGYRDIQFDYCIIDEAQNIKNPIAQNTKVVKEIKAKVRFALTGTPIENNLTELWSIFDFIMPGYLYTKETFNDKFISNDDIDLEKLKLLIKPFILRRTKSEVMRDLPDKIEKRILVEMTAAQKAIYSSYIKTIRTKIKKDFEGKIDVFSYLTKLRQICLDPSLIFKEYEGESGKIKIAMSLVEEQISNNGKVLLFSQFTSVLKKIGESLKGKNIEYFYLDGSTASKERINLVDEFNNNDKIKVFLISLKAGGTGLNLTSANFVIHFDPWWNPAVENQATDRAHRIGQRNVVEVVKLVARGTIEEKIILLQEHKKELIDTVITGELKNSSMLNKLSKEELIKIFHRD